MSKELSNMSANQVIQLYRELEISEKNKLIAEFDGWVIEVGMESVFNPFYTKDNGLNIVQLSNIKYNTSWDWLMPVVEKIEFTWNPFNDNCLYDDHEFSEMSINSTCVSIETCGYKNEQYILFSHTEEWKLNENVAEAKRKAVWLACVNFIQWYNTQK